MLHQPAAHTDGDEHRLFRRSDVVVAGDVLDTTRFLRRSTSREAAVFRGDQML